MDKAKQLFAAQETPADITADQAGLQFSDPNDQRQERMRHLAKVFIEMFLVRKLSQPERLTASEEAA